MKLNNHIRFRREKDRLLIVNPKTQENFSVDISYYKELLNLQKGIEKKSGLYDDLKRLGWLEPSNQYIVTVLPTLKKAARNELVNCEVNELNNEIWLVKSDDLKLHNSIFIRHIFPVNLEFNMMQDYTDIEELKNLKVTKNFTVQVRKIHKKSIHTCKDLEVKLGTYFESKGFKPFYNSLEFMKQDVEVISVLIAENKLYAGVSNWQENLSPLSDFSRYFSKEKQIVNRAENKLKEAILVFNLDIKGNALDIGAAPGGWSAVLKQNGAKVVAVDPAEMNVGVEHFKGKIEDYKPNKKFDLICNDMNMNPLDSAKITANFKEIKQNTILIFTCKLVNKKYEKTIEQTKKILSQKYDITHIKNLFSNHEEVTIIGKAFLN